MTTSTSWWSRRKRDLAVAAGASVILVALTVNPQAAAFQSQQADGDVFVIGVITLAQVPQGEETSSSVVTEPEKFDNVPGLHVTRVAIPKSEAHAVTPSGSGVLDGVVMQTPDGRRQRADGPLTLVPHLGDAFETIKVILAGRPTQPVTTVAVPVEQTPAERSEAPNSPPTFVMPPLAAQGGVTVIHTENRAGTSGNSNLMRVAVDGRSATVVAAKPGTVFWQVPATLEPGMHQVVFYPGPGRPPVTMPLCVVGVRMTVGAKELVRGRWTSLSVVLLGLEDLPSEAWQAELPPADLVDIGNLTQGTSFRMPKPGDPGVAVLAIDNLTPNVVRMGNSGGRIVLEIHRKDTAGKPYTFQTKLQSLQRGAFSIVGNVHSFLKQVSARPYQPGSAARETANERFNPALR
jgi:hypothetical protein